jgi:hypothetical protein
VLLEATFSSSGRHSLLEIEWQLPQLIRIVDDKYKHLHTPKYYSTIYDPKYEALEV